MLTASGIAPGDQRLFHAAAEIAPDKMAESSKGRLYG
jgi:hypothetical protein